MNTKVLALAVVAILAVAGIGMVMFLNDDDDPSTITIIDGANNKIELDEPLKKVAVLNKNVPTTMNSSWTV